MFTVIFFLVSSVFAVESSNEGFHSFEEVNGVRTMSTKAMDAWRSRELPKQHLGALIDRKALSGSIKEFVEATEFPTKLICYSNDATVAELITFSNKTDEELQDVGNAYALAISASFDAIKKMQTMGENLQEIESFKVFSDDEREGFAQFSSAIARPGHFLPPAADFLEAMQVNAPWSDVTLHISRGGEFSKPRIEKPLKGCAAVRAIFSNLIYEMTSQETTPHRVREIMQKNPGGFCVIPLKNQDELEQLWDTKEVKTAVGDRRKGCLALRTKGQLIFPFPIEKDSQEEKMCALVPTFGFVWGGQGYIMEKEGGYDMGSFFDALVGGPRKRSTVAEIYVEHLFAEKITDTTTPPKQGHERFLFWNVGDDFGMGLLVSNTRLPQLNESRYVALRVFFSGFARKAYYANDHVGPGINVFAFKLMLKDDGMLHGMLHATNVVHKFFIVEKKTQRDL